MSLISVFKLWKFLIVQIQMNIILTDWTFFQEPVIKPVWNTFASSLSGIWKGVGAVFSPITAEMEPIEISYRNENLYDCYTLSRIEAVPSSSGERTSQIQRKVNWVTLNPHGETPQHLEGANIAKEGSDDGNAPTLRKQNTSGNLTNHALPAFESFDFERSDVMEEDVMGCEPGLVYFEVRFLPLLFNNFFVDAELSFTKLQRGMQ